MVSVAGCGSMFYEGWGPAQCWPTAPPRCHPTGLLGGVPWSILVITSCGVAGKALGVVPEAWAPGYSGSGGAKKERFLTPFLGSELGVLGATLGPAHSGSCLGSKNWVSCPGLEIHAQGSEEHRGMGWQG